MKEKKGLRLWPIWVLLAVDLAWVFWLWRGEIDQRQSRLMATMGIQLLMAFLIGLHLLFFARLEKKARLRLLAVGVGVGLLAAATLQIREVSGDVVPILSWRWSKPPEARLENRDQLATDLTFNGDGPSYPRFLGPDGNGILAGPDLAESWNAVPPREVWRIEIGSGWSGFAVMGQLAVTMEQRADKEMTTCYNLSDGTLLWSQGLEGRFESTIAGDGPRSTPTLAGNFVLTMGALGRLSCMELSSGRLVWSHDLAKDFGAVSPEWGFAGSPLVFESTVIINAGAPENRLLLAFDVESGELLWQAGNDRVGYSSPQLCTLAGTESILLLNGSSVTFNRPQDGFSQLTLPWKKNQPNVANPLVLPGDQVLVSSGYGVGAALYQIRAEGQTLIAEEIWKNLRLKAKFANFVYHGDHVYGLDDGILTCIAIADGNRVWKAGRYGHGQLLLVKDKLLVQSEDGELFLIKASPDNLVELGKLQVLNGKAWNTMALVGNRLLMRNHREAVCLELPVQTPVL